LLVRLASGQSREELFRNATDLQKNHKLNEALSIFKSLLKTDSNNVELLNRVSFLLAYPVYEGKTDAQKEKKYSEAYYLASKVTRINSKNAEGHYHMALALGRMSEYASTKVKISYARQIRASCEKAISLNPTLPGPYHILARWHREVAGFNMLERAMIAAFYGGGLEGGTYEEALKNFKISLRLDPNNSVHYYEIGVTYYERDNGNDREVAKDWLKKAINMKIYDDTDLRIQGKAMALLKKI
jgi:tetratricopeptide (TPR) repeat protein